MHAAAAAFLQGGGRYDRRSGCDRVVAARSYGGGRGQVVGVRGSRYADTVGSVVGVLQSFLDWLVRSSERGSVVEPGGGI